jgi:hypothetical protein
LIASKRARIFLAPGFRSNFNLRTPRFARSEALVRPRRNCALSSRETNSVITSRVHQKQARAPSSVGKHGSHPFDLGACSPRWKAAATRAVLLQTNNGLVHEFWLISTHCRFSDRTRIRWMQCQSNFVSPYIHCGRLLHTFANTSCLEFSRENRCLPSSTLTSERPRRPQREEALQALTTKWPLQGQKQRSEAEPLSVAWCGDTPRW